MPHVLTSSIALFIGLVMFFLTLLFIYTIVAEQLEDDTEWMFWTRMRILLAGHWHKNRAVLARYAGRALSDRQDNQR